MSDEKETKIKGLELAQEPEDNGKLTHQEEQEAEEAEGMARALFEGAGPEEEEQEGEEYGDQEFPPVEACCAHIARHPQDRYGEIIKMMNQAIELKGPGNPPSMAEILAQREAEEAGPQYHAFLSMVERVELVRQGCLALGKAMEAVAQAQSPAPYVNVPRLTEALELLDQAAPHQVVDPEDAVDDPEEGEEVKA